MFVGTSSHEVRGAVLCLTGQYDPGGVSQSRQSRGQFCDTSETRHMARSSCASY